MIMNSGYHIYVWQKRGTIKSPGWIDVYNKHAWVATC